MNLLKDNPEFRQDVENKVVEFLRGNPQAEDDMNDVENTEE